MAMGAARSLAGRAGIGAVAGSGRSWGAGGLGMELGSGLRRLGGDG